jgi:hypothetical protein
VRVGLQAVRKNKVKIEKIEKQRINLILFVVR